MSVPLFTSGRIRHGVAAATSTLNATQDDRDRAVLDVKLDVATAYINVLRAQSSVVSLRSFAADVQNVYDEGIVPKNDLLAAKVALADARQRELQVHNTLDIARAAYNRLLGRPLIIWPPAWFLQSRAGADGPAECPAWLSSIDTCPLASMPWEHGSTTHSRPGSLCSSGYR